MDYKNWYSQLPCLTFSIKRDGMKPPPLVVHKSAGGSLTRRPKEFLCEIFLHSFKQKQLYIFFPQIFKTDFNHMHSFRHM